MDSLSHTNSKKVDGYAQLHETKRPEKSERNDASVVDKTKRQSKNIQTERSNHTLNDYQLKEVKNSIVKEALDIATKALKISNYPSTESVQKKAPAKKFKESSFRADKKYAPVLNSIKLGKDEINNENLKGLKDNEKFKLRLILEGTAQYKGKDKDAEKCEKHLMKALDILQGDRKTDKMSQRHALKKYKSHMRQALKTDFYKENCQKTDGHPLVKLLNYLCFKEYTKVDIGETTQTLSEGRADKGKIEPFRFNENLKNSDNKTKLKASLDRQLLNKNHKAVGNKESLGQKLKGEMTQLRMDPNMNGNPANVKCKLHNGKKIITNIRTPTPTDGNQKVNHEFKAFLRHLKDHGKKYTMFNLQNRTKPPKWKRLLGLDGENIRSKNLEALKNEFEGVIDVYTLDKNSHFYHQSPSKRDLKNMIAFLGDTLSPDKIKNYEKRLAKKDSEDWSNLADELRDKSGAAAITPSQLYRDPDTFINEFLEQLTSDNSGYHIPANGPQKEDLNNTLNFVKETFFKDKFTLSPNDRQNFIEISYLFLTDQFVNHGDADFYNQSCKDCIDRGGGANWLQLAFMTALEAYGAERNEFKNSTPLDKRMEALSAKLEEDSLWARKRGLIEERLVRASNAINTLIQAFDNADSATMEEIKHRYNFKEVDYKTAH